MKKLLRCLFAAALVLCLTGAAAFAAEAPVSVQLDGKNVTFTDVQPVIRNDRTFLPFRAVFEAMGAQVGWDKTTRTVTAVREGKTVTMTIGSAEATVTENGKTETIAMDVAPYIENDRTYVPVRFAAQAMGTNVGWDKAARTVVLVDTEKLVDSALEGKSFTYLEKLMEHSRKYNEGIWNSQLTYTGAIDADLSRMTELPAVSVPVALTVNGITQDDARAQIGEKITADLSSVIDAAAEAMTGTLASASAQEQAEAQAALAQAKAMASALAKDGLGVEVRGDLSTGKLYLNLDLSALGDLLDSLGESGISFDSNTWYVMDMNAILAQSGMDMDFAQLLEQAKDVDYKAMLAGALSSADVDSTGSYTLLSTVLKTAVNALCDDGFVKNGDTYTTILQGAVENFSGKAALTFTMKNDTVTAYGVEMAFDANMEELSMAMNMKLSVDEKDKVAGSMTMNVMELVKADFDITGGYTRGTAAPVTEPPAGAAVVDLMELAAKAAVAGAPLPVQP